MVTASPGSSRTRANTTMLKPTSVGTTSSRRRVRYCDMASAAGSMPIGSRLCSSYRFSRCARRPAEPLRGMRNRGVAARHYRVGRPPERKLFVEPQLGNDLRAAAVIRNRIEVAHPGRQTKADHARGAGRVIHLLGQVALNVEELLLAFGFVDRAHLLFDHVGQFVVVDRRVIARTFG